MAQLNKIAGAHEFAMLCFIVNASAVFSSLTWCCILLRFCAFEV